MSFYSSLCLFVAVCRYQTFIVALNVSEKYIQKCQLRHEVNATFPTFYYDLMKSYMIEKKSLKTFKHKQLPKFGQLLNGWSHKEDSRRHIAHNTGQPVSSCVRYFMQNDWHSTPLFKAI